MTAELIHAESAADLILLDERPKFRMRYDGLDTASLRYLANSEDAIVQGGLVPDAPGFVVDEVQPQQVDDLHFEIEATVIGLRSTKAVRRLPGYPKPAPSMDDWDTVSDGWITANPRQFSLGQRGSFGGNTVCVSAPSEKLHPLLGLYKVFPTYKGFLANKPRNRVVTVNGQTISGDNIVVNLPGGWSTGRKATVQLPKVVVKDTYFGTTPPPTGSLPGNLVPIGAPAVKFITFNGSDLTSHWPARWHLAAINSEEIGQSGLYKNEWVYEYAHPTTP